MNIPIIIYTVSKILAILSLTVEIITGVISFFLISSKGEYYIKAVDGIFSSGIKVRNSACCFLVLLFCVTNRRMAIGEFSALEAISSVCKTYAVGSVAVFIIGIVVSICISAKEIHSSGSENYGRKLWHSGLLSSIFGFLFAYLFYIP